MDSLTCSRTMSPTSLAYTTISGSLTITRSRIGQDLHLFIGDEIGARFVVEEFGDVVSKDQLEITDRTVALLSDDDLGDPLLLGVLVVDLIAIDERNEVG